jgi:hypothetical protein
MSNRFLLLIVGFLAGIIVGGVLFRYMSFDLGKNIFIINKPSAAAQKEKPDNKEDGKEDQKDSRSTKKKPTGNTEYVPVDPTLSSQDEQIEAEANNNTFAEDSLQATVAEHLPLKNIEEQIVIRKDELLFAAPVNVINLDVTEVKMSKKDSLLQAASGIKEPASSPVVIEFWKSPVNYRGYKFTKNKLVLFGMHTQDFPKLYKLNDSFYLRSGEKFFKIERLPEFRSYEQIQDPALLSKFN